MRRQSQCEEFNTGVTWQELKIKRKEEFQSWRRNPPWENSRTEQAAFVGTEQNWGVSSWEIQDVELKKGNTLQRRFGLCALRRTKRCYIIFIFN